jgi:hypothetical protein
MGRRVVPARRPNPRLMNPIYEKPKETKVLTPIAYDLAYGEDSAAQPGMVMLRIAKDGKILCELNMPPEEFLQLAHAIENVGRAVAEFTKD